MTIEAILDQCLEDLRQHRASVADCLARHREYAKELEPLLLAAVALEQMPEVEPSPEFKRGLRDRILSFDRPEATEPIRDLLSSSDRESVGNKPNLEAEEQESHIPVSSVPPKKQGS